MVVVDGRIQFLAHGYTTSDSFPYSAEVEVGGRRVNYMRGAVVANVDAFSGRVTLYATESEDPILRAWRGAFPTLFTPASEMPAALRAHLRYPRELFDAQSEIWETYHIDNVDDFYTKADAWQRPAEISGPIERVGSIRFRSGNFEDGQRGAAEGLTMDVGDRLRPSPRMRPYFLLARLPGDRQERFMLTTVFTPHSQENLSGYLTGTMDARGRPRLTELTLPRSRLVLGPSQVSRQILATPEVGDRLRLLNQETADLGKQAVNAVELSEPRVVPIGDSFLYVQPIYVTAAGKRRDEGAPGDRVPQRPGGLRQKPARGAAAGPSAGRLTRRVRRPRPQRPSEGRNRPSLGREDVHRDHEVDEGERGANGHDRHRQLDGEQHEHHHRVAAPQPERHQHRYGEERLAHREHDLDLLAGEERQRPAAGAGREGDAAACRVPASTGSPRTTAARPRPGRRGRG